MKRTISKQIIEQLTAPFLLFENAKSRYAFAIGAVVFCLLFLILFIPYNINNWISTVSPIENMEIPSIGISGGLFILASHAIQARYFKKRAMKNYHILVGFVFDLLFISCCLSSLYSSPQNNLWSEFTETFRLVTPILALWYIIGLSMLKIITQQATPLLPTTPTVKEVSSQEVINFYDENQHIQLTLACEALLYIESADNYIVIHYTEVGVLSKKMIRNSLKNIEAIVQPFNCLRCHRSYIVNLDQAAALTKINSMHMLQLKACDTLIPISRSTIQTIKMSLSNTLVE
jgi:TRAP-type C4-dicarboxylate transport system permease small subunit